MKISTIIKGSVCVLGLVGVSNFFAAPAKADQAAARGAVTIVRPSGSSISVSGEVVAAPGTDFTDVTVTFTGSDPGTNLETISDLTVTPTAAAATGDATTIEAAIATAITDGAFTNLEDVAALVRAYSAGGLE
ncbi:MAG: hypothetical protein RMY62_030230 [Nostoc sp. ZfuVER08]|jgi:hypothetical protein|uniref:Uncharacterized protein n=1 Tax=Nostoc punctiforme FACHB-252 TaxID=1357509 RepID=A0ABR8H5Q8_NOSPU|nr:hypothetical protein [Nostoc punctiforme]MBD2610581.1 hypothetical protein [Nostoc punctiforme FACHB-252]MBL1198360.1 hypothetical protein [Nostoc sp. GBBB01]MDZ8011749.1 hypothetical protein [Nostoc sp. ZfuVER08]